MKMKDLNPKDHPEYFEKFDDSVWKKINDNLENLSHEEFQAIIHESCQRALEEYKKKMNKE